MGTRHSLLLEAAFTANCLWLYVPLILAYRGKRMFSDTFIHGNFSNLSQRIGSQLESMWPVDCSYHDRRGCHSSPPPTPPARYSHHSSYAVHGLKQWSSQQPSHCSRQLQILKPNILATSVVCKLSSHCDHGLAHADCLSWQFVVGCSPLRSSSEKSSFAPSPFS